MEFFQIWEKMGSENLRKDKVDYILKNFEDILEIYIIIEKKDMQKMKKNIQELHHRRRELRKELGKIIEYSTISSKYFDYVSYIGILYIDGRFICKKFANNYLQIILCK